MKKNSLIKSIVLIVTGGILFLFSNFINDITGLYYLFDYSFYLVPLIALVLVVLGLIPMIKMALNNKTEEHEVLIENNQKSNQHNMNKIENVTLTSGIIGFLGTSPKKTLNKVISKENANGWEVVQVIPADSGNIFLIAVRLLILVLTLFLYTKGNGYYLVMKKV